MFKLNPLTAELPRHGVPRPNIILTVFFEIFKPIFRLYGNEFKTRKPVFRPYRVRGLIQCVWYFVNQMLAYNAATDHRLVVYTSRRYVL